MIKYTLGDIRALVHLYEVLLPLEIEELLVELIDKGARAVDWEEETETDRGPEISPYLITAAERLRRGRVRKERTIAEAK